MSLIYILMNITYIFYMPNIIALQIAIYIVTRTMYQITNKTYINPKNSTAMKKMLQIDI